MLKSALCVERGGAVSGVEIENNLNKKAPRRSRGLL